MEAWAREEGLVAYDQATQEGYLRHLVVREGRNTGQMLVQLVTAKGRRFEEGYLVEVLRRFPEVRSIHWAVNDSPAEVTNLPTTLLWGEDAIEEEILGLRFRVRPNAFLQTNTEMAATLYDLAREFAGLRGGETVYDLYCGTGTIGLALAEKALTVWGVEISEESVACAIENAELNGITNAAFFAGNVSLALEELRDRAGPPDVVVVDPPRAGLAGKALRRMARLEAPRIVYVSCNPTTLASDAKQLRDDFGYELRRCRPVDMFPHTPHIESVNLLRAASGLSRAARELRIRWRGSFRAPGALKASASRPRGFWRSASGLRCMRGFVELQAGSRALRESCGSAGADPSAHRVPEGVRFAAAELVCELGAAGSQLQAGSRALRESFGSAGADPSAHTSPEGVRFAAAGSRILQRGLCASASSRIGATRGASARSGRRSRRGSRGTRRAAPEDR